MTEPRPSPISSVKSVKLEVMAHGREGALPESEHGASGARTINHTIGSLCRTGAGFTES